MGVTPYAARARRALMFKQNSTLWAAIGRTTPWDNENAPPSPAPSATDIEEAIVFVRPAFISLAKPVTSGGDVLYLGQSLTFVADNQAIAQGARFLYVRTVFNPSDGIPHANFREFAIFSGLAAVSGHETDVWLAPANVSSRGILEYLSYKEPSSLNVDELRTIEAIIEFR